MATTTITIEIAGLADLVDAINNLNATYAAAAGGMATPTADEARPTRKPRANAKDASPAAASDTTGASTRDPAAAPASDPAGTSSTASSAVVDAGTGKPITADRGEAKVLAGKLTTLDGGNETLTALLKKHVPDGQVVKFGNVPDAAIGAFTAEVDAEINRLSALAD